MQAGKMITVEIWDEPDDPRRKGAKRQLLERAELECVRFDAETGISDFRAEIARPRTDGAGPKWIEGTVKAFPFAKCNLWDLLAVALQTTIGTRSDAATLERARQASLPGAKQYASRHDAEALETD